MTAKKIDTLPYLASFFLCCAVTLSFLMFSDAVLHWFLIPLIGCGVVIGKDAWDWATGKCDIFDPVGVTGVFGFFFFFLAPLMHVSLDFWTINGVVPPLDWRPWLGYAAIINLAGLFFYRITLVAVISGKEKAHSTVWVLNRRRFFVGLVFFAAGSLALWVYVMNDVGWIQGMIARYDAREGEDAFKGFGLKFLFTEKFPLFLFWGWLVFVMKSQRTKNSLAIIVVMLLYFALCFVFGGLRGSRSNVIWPMIWGLGLVHFYLRPITRRTIVVLGLLFVTYMYGYAFYKAGGSQNIADIATGARTIEDAETSGKRSLPSLFLVDLARGDMQAFMVYRQMEGDKTYLGWGQSYVGGIAKVIPDSIMTSPFLSKSEYGTALQFGGRPVQGMSISTRIYGLMGEGLLNFGIFLAPLVFIGLGVIVGKARNFMTGLRKDDARWLLFHFFIPFCILFLSADLDNVFHYFVKQGLLPFLLIFISVKRIPSSSLETVA